MFPGTDFIELLVILPATLLGGWLLMLFFALFQVAMARVFNLEFGYIQFFGTKIVKKDGKFTTEKCRFSLFPSSYVHPAPGAEIKKSVDIIDSLLVFLIPSLLVLGISAIYVIKVKKGFYDGLLRTVLSSFLMGASILAVCSIVVSLKTVIGMFGKNLHNFRNMKVREFRQTDDINNIYIPSLDELKDYKGNKLDQVAYQTVRFLWAEMRRDINVMGEVAEWLRIYDSMNPNLGSGNTPIRFSLIRSLVLYYSIWNIDPDRARKYYASAARELDSDDDINGLRLRAYYTMNILGDRNKALELAKAGFNKPEDPRFSKLEEIHERRFLQELITFIEGADNEQQSHS